MKCPTGEGTRDAAAAKLIGDTSKTWVCGVFRSYLTVNGDSAATRLAVTKSRDSG